MSYFALLSRQSMQNSTRPQDNTSSAHRDSSAPEQLTWQQQQSFPESDRNTNGRHHARGAAPTSRPAAPTGPFTHASSHTHHRFQHQRIPQTHTLNNSNMRVIPPGVFIPPHLRNKPNVKLSPKASPVGTSAGSKSNTAEALLPTPPGTSSPVKKTMAAGKTTLSKPAESDEWGANWDTPKPAESDGWGANWDTPKPAESDAWGANWDNPKPAESDGSGAICDTPKPSPPAGPSKRNRNPRWPKITRARHIWPKNKDMKAASQYDEDYEVDESWGACKSDSDRGEDYDVRKLTDWNGDWMPPPVDWMARNQFTDLHLGDGIERWINGHPPPESGLFLDPSKYASLMINGEISKTDTIGYLKKPKGRNAGDGYTVEERDKINASVVAKELAEYQRLIKANAEYIAKEIAPRYWVPSKIENCSPHQFWNDFKSSSRAPAPVSDIDISEHRPYWDYFDEDDQANFFLPQPIAPIVLMDKDDEEYENPNARASYNEVSQKMQHKQQKRARRYQAKMAAPLPPITPYQPPPSLKPTANIYLRPVNATDAEAIRGIYNWYVANGVSVPEFVPRTVEHMIERIHTVTTGKLPYVVAVAKGHGPRNQAGFVRERVVGFASIDDYCDIGSMYRYTFELELFTHPDWLRKGIAKCLMDRLLSTVNTGYMVKGGYEWVNRGEYLKEDAERLVKTINVTVPHEAETDNKWLVAFFKRFGFVERGRLTKMGYKYGKVVDVTIFQHTTSERINPAQRPLRPL